MSEKTSMFELLKERLTKEEIIKIVCDYDFKFYKLEKENKQLKSQLQQKENIIKELKERSLQYSEEIDRLLDIKNEVREYVMTELITEWDIKNDGYVCGSDLPVDAITPILEILDKENK